MNASVRRVFDGRGRNHNHQAPAGGGRFRRTGAGRLLLAGIFGVAPVIATAAAPTAPLPPMLPVAGKPASTSLFSKLMKPAATPQEAGTAEPGGTAQPSGTAQAGETPQAGETLRAAGSPQSGATAAGATAQTQPAAGAAKDKQSSTWIWNPAETFAGLFAAAPAAPVRTPAPAATRGKSPDPAPQPSASGSTATATAAATAKRRFDPDLGAAGLVVSDSAGSTAAGRGTPQDEADFLAAAPAFPAPPAAGPEPEAREPVNLVSWLSQSYSELVAGEGYGHDGMADAGAGVCVTDCCCPTWQVQVDALFFWQGNIPSRPLFVDTVTQQTALDANQLQNRAAIAPRYAVIYNRDDCRAVEVNYFAAWGFNAVQELGHPEFPVLDPSGDGALSTVGLLGTQIDGVGLVRATSSAHIKSFEANLRSRQDGGFVQWISGFRWLEWGQGLAIQDALYSGGAPVAFDSFDVSTLNSLYGWQLGGDATLWNAGRWVRINGVGKAGLYYNQAVQNSAYFNGFDPPVGYADSKDVAAFVGETGVNASIALTKWLSWRAGYSFFWLSGVATPARQLNQTDVLNGTTAVNATGSVFLQAATTGLEARW